MWMLLPLWLVVGHDLLECKYMHGWRHGKIVLFALFNMARGFEYACETISDKTSESLQKSLAGTIYKEEKWKNGDKKSSWRLENV